MSLSRPKRHMFEPLGSCHIALRFLVHHEQALVGAENPKPRLALALCHLQTKGDPCLANAIALGLVLKNLDHLCSSVSLMWVVSTHRLGDLQIASPCKG